MENPTVKTRTLTLGALALLISAASASTLQAQASTSALQAQKKVADIVQQAIARNEARTAKIDNYTIHQSAFGIEMTVRFERQDVDGKSVLVPVSTNSSMGQIPLDQAKEQAAYTDPWSTFAEWMSGATLEGESEIDGKSVWMIRMNEFPLDAFMVPEGDEAGSFEPQTALMFVDQEEYLLHRLELDGIIKSEGKERDMSMVTILSDYRGELGLLHPHSIKTEVAGLMDDEQAAEARENMAEMKKQLDAMDPNQRRMVEAALKGQMEQLESVLSGGNMTLEIVTTKLEVNTPAAG